MSSVQGDISGSNISSCGFTHCFKWDNLKINKYGPTLSFDKQVCVLAVHRRVSYIQQSFFFYFEPKVETTKPCISCEIKLDTQFYVVVTPSPWARCFGVDTLDSDPGKILSN